MRIRNAILLALAAVTTTYSATSLAQALTNERPSAFGIEMGLPLERLNIRYKGEANTYIVVPQPNDAFNKYIVLATPDGGVCEVTAVTPRIEEDDRYGTVVMARFAALSAKLAEKYGTNKPQRTNSFDKSDLNSAPHYFTMSIMTEERIVADIWSRRSNPALTPGLRSIILRVMANNWLNPFVELKYSFTNIGDCLPPAPGSKPLTADGL